MARPEATVVIPTVGRTRSLIRVIGQLLSMSTIPIEVIVIQDGPPVEPMLARSLAPLCIIFLPSDGPRLGSAVARNLGATRAHGDYLVFLDDDVELGLEWHEELAIAIGKGLPAWTGLITGERNTLLAAAREVRYSARYSGLNEGDHVSFFPGGNSAVRRDLFEAAGGFPEFRTGSDNALASALLSMGVPIAYSPTFMVSHHHDRGWRVAARAAFEAGMVDTGQGLRRDFGVSIGHGSSAVRAANLAFTAVKALGFMVSRMAR